MWKRGGGPGVPPAYTGRVQGGLVGRDRELFDLRELVEARRLVTVAGGVGVGKSRLAAAAVTRPARGLWERVVKVRWRDVRPAGPAQVTAAVFHAVTGAPPPAKAVDVGELAVLLRAGGGTLLFLDDIDPVHTACVGVVQKLLEYVPSLRVLVTSRRPLGLGDERVLRLGRLDREAAAELFLERARAVRPPGEGAVDGGLVEAVCQELDGLPLAVEMAAEQLAQGEPGGPGAPGALVRRLRVSGQCWLTSPRAVLRRHRSMRSAVGAVYGLCDRMERIVWARSSVFAGGFDESAAAFVCVGGSVEPQDVPACLTRLAAAGVLEPSRDPGGPRRPRYRMARAARDFGAERLREAGETEVALERHTVHCRRVAVVAENLWNSGGQPQAALLLEEEQDDLAAMLGRAVEDLAGSGGPVGDLAGAGGPVGAGVAGLVGPEGGAVGAGGGAPSGGERLVRPGAGGRSGQPVGPDRVERPGQGAGQPVRPGPVGPVRPEQALELLETVVDLWFWWVVYGRAEEGRRYLLGLLPHCPRDRAVTVRGLWLAAWLSAGEDPRAAGELLRQAWPSAVLRGDDVAVGRIAHVQGVLALHARDPRGAAEHFREAAAMVPPRAMGGPSPAVSLAALAVAQAGFAPRAAHRTARRALAGRGVRGDAWACLVARYACAFVDHRRGRSGQAWRRARRALASLDARAPVPYGADAVRRLLADIEAGRPGWLPLPTAIPPQAVGEVVPPGIGCGDLGRRQGCDQVAVDA